MILAVRTSWETFINLVGWIPLFLLRVSSRELAAESGSYLNADR